MTAPDTERTLRRSYLAYGEHDDATLATPEDGATRTTRAVKGFGRPEQELTSLTGPEARGNPMAIAETPHDTGRTIRIDPRVDPQAWVANNERITHEGALEDWIALYTDDAVRESIVDGGVERSEGIDAIAHAARILVKVYLAHNITIKKQLVCATENVIVNTWTGGFDGHQNQRGVEIWKLRDDLVAHQQMYTFLDVRPMKSLRARLRGMFGGELRVKLTLLRETARADKAAT
jgi:hypothetical protein